MLLQPSASSSSVQSVCPKRNTKACHRHYCLVLCLLAHNDNNNRARNTTLVSALTCSGRAAVESEERQKKCIESKAKKKKRRSKGKSGVPAIRHARHTCGVLGGRERETEKRGEGRQAAASVSYSPESQRSAAVSCYEYSRYKKIGF